MGRGVIHFTRGEVGGFASIGVRYRILRSQTVPARRSDRHLSPAAPGPEAQLPASTSFTTGSSLDMISLVAATFH